MNAPSYPQASPPKRGMPTWVIVLICTGGALAILVPVLAVLAVYGVRKYIANAKTAEARMELVEIGKDAVVTYDASTGFCASARAVPADAKDVRARKYMSAPSDWGTSGDKAIHAGFPCLGFSMTQPQYYQYRYDSSTPMHQSFEAVAHGDLDGDGVTSGFALRGSAVGGEVSVSPSIDETSPEE